MTSLHLSEDSLPSLHGKTAVITGGASGIGLAAAHILARKGCSVHVLDLNPIHQSDLDAEPSLVDLIASGTIRYVHCDVTSWIDLRAAFDSISRVDIAVANAGVSEECDYFQDVLNADGELTEPRYGVLDVNLRAVLNFTKLALRAFKAQGPGGSLVITTSATAYSPEQSLPVYSSTKLALVGLIRALRPSIHLYGATINGVAPAATITRLLPGNLAAPIMAAGAPVSTARHVGLAVAYSATASQARQVEGYGRDSPAQIQSPGRWNGRVIITLGDAWTEIEEPMARLRWAWFGEENTRLTAFQQVLTDMRPDSQSMPDKMENGKGATANESG
ncbi:hypothetical protein BDP81DRAFT_515426 [Colletotrichum phormii]|uniref:Uncharacterized protein n=1 Tax=Colletotrichum phormii TaxID=359342 RepID=A0AAI9ZTR9_9PEZI|nr:uncharacterized protein BDP81DRAFT_515426 [Colletotrichum phormii]KAK1638011.1 hypothetical protein BDP81DRAFT_515426 [Colletotrichum phormii]